MDGENSWVKLKDIKELYPLKVDYYAITNKILEEPAFYWRAKIALTH